MTSESPTPDAFRELRARHGLSQAQLAERCPRVSVRSIQHYEQGRQCHPAVWAYILAQLGELRLPEPTPAAR
jgi:transcriptional regulator with XRE-family HTH domain